MPGPPARRSRKLGGWSTPKTLCAATLLGLSLVCCLATSAEPLQNSMIGLRLAEEGKLFLGNVPFQGFGVNYYSALQRRMNDPRDTSYREGLVELHRYNIPFARFMAGGFWPADWRIYESDKARWFEALDDVVRSAEAIGIGLIPSLFWYPAGVSDFVGEPLNRWGIPGSKTLSFMKQYTKEVMDRYRDSPAIWAWEFGNEFNLAADLPNAADHRPKIVPRLGTAETRSEEDEVSHEDVALALRLFAETVRAMDPTRAISTGNSIPRPSAAHQRSELSWKHDTVEEFCRNLWDITPDPNNLMSVHLYPASASPRFDRDYVAFEELLPVVLDAASEKGKAVFVGEFGAVEEDNPGSPDRARQQFHELLNAMELSGVPLAALWVYDFDHQEESINVSMRNHRKYMLEALQKANRRLKLNAFGSGNHFADLAGGGFHGRLLDNTANLGRAGNGFTPLIHAAFPGEALFRDELTGLYFEHIFNGTAADRAIAMFTPNGDPHFVMQHSKTSASIHHPAEGSSWGMECSMRYTLAGDGVDLEFTTVPTQDRYPLGFAAFMWASYMNHTRERPIHFYGKRGEEEGWIAFGEDTETGFETGTIAHAGAPELPYEEGAQTLNLIEDTQKRFLLPFYYGLVDGDGEAATAEDTMAYIMMFGQSAPIRFALWNFIRDAAGNADPHSPAWDWQYVIHQPEMGKQYGYRARMAYVPFVSREDIQQRYEAWAAALPPRE